MSNSGMMRKILKYSGNIRFILANSIAGGAMDSNNSKNADAVFSLSLLSGGAAQKNETRLLLKSNEKAQKYGLCSFPEAGGSDYRNTKCCIAAHGRMEFGAGVLGRIAEAFCDSPWISQEDYEQTLHEVTGLFYEFKNETMDIVSDD